MTAAGWIVAAAALALLVYRETSPRVTTKELREGVRGKLSDQPWAQARTADEVRRIRAAGW